MIVRVGLPKATGALPVHVEAQEEPVLISANSLWDDRRGCFRQVPFNIANLDAALDSAGFVAMKAGGYRWAVQAYVGLANSWSWAWWSQMDLCCEPEIARDRAEITARIIGSASRLLLCREVADEARAVGDAAMPDPLPVLQGWQPDDYRRCADLYDGVLDGAWPALVGVGSMCRRHLRGPVGVAAVLQELERHLPAHVRLHLFGVKGPALQHLHGNPRIASVDSMAWDTAARQRARKTGASCTLDLKREEMDRWTEAQKPRGLLSLLGEEP